MMSFQLRSVVAFTSIWAIVLPALAAKALAGPDQSVPMMRLSVNAADAPRRILHARQVLPVTPGPLTLVYPKWIPGEHGPTGPINDLVDLKLTAGGSASGELPWRRDEADMYAIQCKVPADTKEVVAAFDFLTPSSSGGVFSAGPSTSAKLAVISWNQVVLYPQGKSPRDLQITAELTVPTGWKIATALPVAEQHGERTTFKPVSLETLVDSPVQCGAYLKDVPVGPSNSPPHFLHIACDSPEGLEFDESFKEGMDRLVAEAGAMFGSRHYRSYHWLLTLSDHVAHFGLEHHECSDNRAAERLLLDETLRLANVDLLPHEYIHSWNGKYRRPLGMTIKDYQDPERTRLLWVYEGLTDYLDIVLSARSGLCSEDEFLDTLAMYAQYTRNVRGRSWRPLQDTAVSFQLFDTARSDGATRRRSGWDVYVEGALIWLEVDCIIREETRNQRSLDDFCRRFFGGPDGPPTVKIYKFNDVVADLNAVAPYDWPELLDRRVRQTSNAPLVDGIERAGWKLAYDFTPSRMHEVSDREWLEATDLSASIGILVKDDGTIVDVVPDEAADRAGIGPGMKVVAVNERRFTPEVLRSAIAATAEGNSPLQLLMENADYFHSYPLDYNGGEKYPCLKRNKDKPDLLADIVKPRAEK
ncbi:MAG TPA: M61 family peptidase [Phycisphaerae bacterium]|nr:M61 family peptidase [Phycisphaerae bacterium]